jgi:hypothetical protein
VPSYHSRLEVELLPAKNKLKGICKCDSTKEY